MTTTPQQCPKCRGSLEQGFVFDHTYGSQGISQWAQGAPLKSFWSGTKMSGKELIPIGSFRCSSCGYLEFYARPEFAAK